MSRVRTRCGDWTELPLRSYRTCQIRCSGGEGTYRTVRLRVETQLDHGERRWYGYIESAIAAHPFPSRPVAGGADRKAVERRLMALVRRAACP